MRYNTPGLLDITPQTRTQQQIETGPICVNSKDLNIYHSPLYFSISFVPGCNCNFPIMLDISHQLPEILEELMSYVNNSRSSHTTRHRATSAQY